MSEQKSTQPDPAEGTEEDNAARIAELDDRWRRTAAELDNFRKRCAQELGRARDQERAWTAVKWLPVLDNLERALDHASSSDHDQLVEGLQAVQQQALSVLADLGYPRREDAGEAFDPAVHEAIGTVADEELVPGTVATVVRPGYGGNGEVLRPAAVVVATREQ
jgi:molecular chaperone GrpE